MSDLSIVVSASGIEEMLRRLDPKNADRALIIWYERGTQYVRSELRNRAPSRLRGKVVIRTDGLTPPRFARVKVTGWLAHLLEGGTGTLGAPGFRHQEHLPSVRGIMRQTGLPRPEAFLVARSIGERGGNPPKPFIKPTFLTVQQPLVRMAEVIVEKILQGGA
jgi:hypothetical protein